MEAPLPPEVLLLLLLHPEIPLLLLLHPENPLLLQAEAPLLLLLLMLISGGAEVMLQPETVPRQAGVTPLLHFVEEVLLQWLLHFVEELLLQPEEVPLLQFELL